MKIAILSDVHANRAALVAVLAAIDAEGVDHLVCLGDQVGYHAEPDDCVDLLRARGATAVAGNHDRVAAGVAEPRDFNEAARRAILWTRDHQRADTARYLAGLPLIATVDGAFLAVHGALHPEPNADLHLSTAARISRSFAALARGYRARIAFFGHTHRGVVYALRHGQIRTIAGPEVRLDPGARYLINPGSVGQPRDGDARAAFAIWDGRAGAVRFHRVAYDARASLARAEQAGILRGSAKAGASPRRALGWLGASIDAVRRRLP